MDKASPEAKAEFVNAVKQNNQKFMDAFNSRDGATVQSLYTPDCRFMAPGVPIALDNKGIPDFMKFIVEKGHHKIKLETQETWGPVGDMAGERVNVAFDTAEGTRKADIKALLIWKKVGGQWKIHADCWNMDHSEKA